MDAHVEQLEQDIPVQPRKMEFYIVSPEKFLLLYIGTFGMYSVYWFYKHWSQYKKSTHEDLWPVMRAIFAIFFVHSLFENFEQRYKIQTGKAPTSIKYLATIFVILSLVSNVLNILSRIDIGTLFTDYAAILFLPVFCWTIYKAQILANKSGPDVGGLSNNKLTFLNYFWLLLGLVFWLLFLLGLFIIIFSDKPIS
ncbi:MAG: hypothetical protein KA902_00760 [Arenimonas sp.]|nr:hypothetical protein [Arenimonas sp.]